MSRVKYILMVQFQSSSPVPVQMQKIKTHFRSCNKGKCEFKNFVHWFKMIWDGYIPRMKLTCKLKLLTVLRWVTQHISACIHHPILPPS